jgi:3-deoxy-D-manno-octulosonic-acid transferase
VHEILLSHMPPRPGAPPAGTLFGDRVAGQTDFQQAYLPYDFLPLVMAFPKTRAPHPWRHHGNGNLAQSVCRLLSVHMGIPLFLVNARLSERSARGYARLARLDRTEALRSADGLAAQSAEDDAPSGALGAAESSRSPAISNSMSRRPRHRVSSIAGAPAPSVRWPKFVWLAASTREGEEALLLEAFDRLGCGDACWCWCRAIRSVSPKSHA